MMNPTISSQLLGINEESDVLLNEIHENTKDMEKENSNEKCKQSKPKQNSTKRDNPTILMENVSHG